MLVVAATVLIASIAIGQHKNTQKETQVAKVERSATVKVNPELMAQRRTERLDKSLALDAEQKKQVNAIFLKQAQEQGQRAAHNEQTEKEIKALLTDHQIQRFDEMKANQKAMMLERSAQKRGETKMSPAGSK